MPAILLKKMAERLRAQGEEPTGYVADEPLSAMDMPAMGGMAVKAPLASEEIRRLATRLKIGQIGFGEQKFPFTQTVKVTLPNGEVFHDAVKGLNEGHAMARAAANWPDALEIAKGTKSVDPQIMDMMDKVASMLRTKARR